jgi:hypothetical protein
MVVQVARMEIPPKLRLIFCTSDFKAKQVEPRWHLMPLYPLATED